MTTDRRHVPPPARPPTSIREDQYASKYPIRFHIHEDSRSIAPQGHPPRLLSPPIRAAPWLVALLVILGSAGGVRVRLVTHLTAVRVPGSLLNHVHHPPMLGRLRRTLLLDGCHNGRPLGRRQLLSRARMDGLSLVGTRRSGGGAYHPPRDQASPPCEPQFPGTSSSPRWDARRRHPLGTGCPA